jgi:spermidine/putrescine-binding protein
VRCLQVRVFSSTDHVRALGAGDVDAVVGWSDDLLPLVERTNNLEAAAPLSGTTLFADCWCIPTAAAGG